MRLTRNISPDGLCKYAAVRNDKIADLDEAGFKAAQDAMSVLAGLGVLENPKAGDPEEFFLIKLKDMHAPAGLWAYAADAEVNGDGQLAQDVYDLSRRADARPDRKRPD